MEAKYSLRQCKYPVALGKLFAIVLVEAEYSIRQCNSIPMKCILTYMDIFLGDFEESEI
jgi:hypothetical protein